MSPFEVDRVQGIVERLFALPDERKVGIPAGDVRWLVKLVGDERTKTTKLREQRVRLLERAADSTLLPEANAVIVKAMRLVEVFGEVDSPQLAMQELIRACDSLQRARAIVLKGQA